MCNTIIPDPFCRFSLPLPYAGFFNNSLTLYLCICCSSAPSSCQQWQCVQLNCLSDYSIASLIASAGCFIIIFIILYFSLLLLLFTYLWVIMTFAFFFPYIVLFSDIVEEKSWLNLFFKYKDVTTASTINNYWQQLRIDCIDSEGRACNVMPYFDLFFIKNTIRYYFLLNNITIGTYIDNETMLAMTANECFNFKIFENFFLTFFRLLIQIISFSTLYLRLSLFQNLNNTFTCL